MDRKLLAILISSTLVIGFSIYWFYPLPPKSVEESQRHFMHCRSCSKEFPYNVDRFPKPCPLCSAEKSLVATKESLEKAGAGPSPYTNLILALIVEANLILGALLAYFLYSPKKNEEDEFLYSDCDHCHQRLKFKASRIGAKGQCPRCRKPIVFPDVALDDEQELPWWQPVRWQRACKTWVNKKIQLIKNRQAIKQEATTEEENE